MGGCRMGTAGSGRATAPASVLAYGGTIPAAKKSRFLPRSAPSPTFKTSPKSCPCHTRQHIRGRARIIPLSPRAARVMGEAGGTNRQLMACTGATPHVPTLGGMLAGPDLCPQSPLLIRGALGKDTERSAQGLDGQQGWAQGRGVGAGSYLRGQHVLGEVEREGGGRPCSARGGGEGSVLQASPTSHRGQQMSHAHGGEGAGGHGELSRVDEEGLPSAQGAEELLPMEAGEGQALQVPGAQVRGAVRVHHQRGEGLLAQPSALRVLLARVRLFPPSFHFVLLQTPSAEHALAGTLPGGRAVLDLLWAAPLLAPLLWAAGAAAGRRVLPAGAGRCRRPLLRRLLHLRVAVSPRLLLCKGMEGQGVRAESTRGRRGAGHLPEAWRRGEVAAAKSRSLLMGETHSRGRNGPSCCGRSGERGLTTAVLLLRQTGKTCLMEDQNLLRHRSRQPRTPGGRRSGGRGASGWTALEEMVLRIFNYTELINSAPWVYSKRAG